VTAQHDVDYVLIESPKPGGAEPVNPLSGWDVVMRPADSSKPDTPAPSGRNEHGIFREEYDDRSALFLPHLPAGRWEIVYTMNATFTGNFRILPVQASPMYLPFVTANSRAGRMAIEDK
jgi:alpha-2-macroglobulin